MRANGRKAHLMGYDESIYRRRVGDDTDAGALTQFRLNSEFPTKNRRSCASRSKPDGWLNASLVASNTVALPPLRSAYGMLGCVRQAASNTAPAKTTERFTASPEPTERTS
mgnify:CR=1 FL=1